jgi:hypothetical protein
MCIRGFAGRRHFRNQPLPNSLNCRFGDEPTVVVLTGNEVLGLIEVMTPMPNRRNFTILAKGLFALALLGNASESLAQTQSGRSTHDISTQDQKRLERFEKQVDDFRARLKIPGLSAVVLKDQRSSGSKDSVSRISRTELLQRRTRYFTLPR